MGKRSVQLPYTGEACERADFIRKRIGDAIKRTSAKYPDIPVEQRPPSVIRIFAYNPNATLADAQLNAAMDLYARGKVGLPTVQRYYKKFVDAQSTWWIGAMQQEAPK
jgi:hypothetical protein